MTPMGCYYSRQYVQSKGIPQGGVLSPMLWLLLINLVPERVERGLQPLLPDVNLAEDYMMQIYADDVSMVLRGADPEKVVEAAHRLIEVLTRVLQEIGLTLSAQKCKNFLMFARSQVLNLFKRSAPSSRWMKTKESARMKALSASENVGDYEEQEQGWGPAARNSEGQQLGGRATCESDTELRGAGRGGGGGGGGATSP